MTLMVETVKPVRPLPGVELVFVPMGLVGVEPEAVLKVVPPPTVPLLLDLTLVPPVGAFVFHDGMYEWNRGDLNSCLRDANAASSR